MYAASGSGQVDHELYLLGKAVDKAVDPMAQENEEVHNSKLKSLQVVPAIYWDRFYPLFVGPHCYAKPYSIMPKKLSDGHVSHLWLL